MDVDEDEDEEEDIIETLERKIQAKEKVKRRLN